MPAGDGVVDYRKAMDIALRLLGFRSRTVRELGKRLAEKGVGDEVAGRVLARLAELGYLDDRRFALDWIKARSGAKCRSAWVLKRELREKGIDPALAEETVEEALDPDAAFPAACAIARQKLSRGGEADLAKWRARVQGALLRRGFDYDFIRRVIAETAPREADGDG